MMKLIRLGGLLSQSIFLQFVHLVGLGAFLIAAALGYFRVPSWTVPILAVAFGVGADRLVDVTDVTGLLEKASKANERGGFLILVYAVITIVGYIVGAYGRHHLEKSRIAAAPQVSAKK
ncbi:MAG: hypothetical protein WAK03_14780 [Methylocystis sp.]|jgi:hypothetical protein